MPKTGLTNKQWRERLPLFAQGKVLFGRGQCPKRGSDRERELKRLEKCPKHKKLVLIDPFGRRIQHLWGYHQQQVNALKFITCYVQIFTHCCTISIQSATPLSTSPGSSSSPSSTQPATTISLIGHSATAELSESTAHIQVSYMYTEHITVNTRHCV